MASASPAGISTSSSSPTCATNSARIAPLSAIRRRLTEMPQVSPEPVGSNPDPNSSDAGAAPPPAVQDLEHPWLGLESFREETRGYFFGREAEIGELHLRLRSHPLLVLYGRSGLGKTSILRAGLIPRLRADKKRPLLVRLRYDDAAMDPAGQLVAA